ncbi:glycosyltransferase family 4 protein [Pedobacter insulae]|uniref:Glycosyltransferase involved in cell wall bisynthesis n=1 Tax=Pedobacter insulae TaxID=414048 RepID=A0A1I2TCF6_9SPHI|nr:glycosyltransferase family 4 protein [Pedobacter insulae]SFG59971.1 Glycosyltransferase involved in cell wall bisynthesis [Pedobacter insulae]
MKVIHLNTYDGNGGAGRACLRLSNALRDNETDSSVLVYYKFGQNPNIINLSKGFFAKARAIINIMAERYLAKIFVKALKTPFSLQWFGKALHHNKLLKEADIIHLHWINHGFLSPKLLASLDELEKPIVWTFHDSNAFTGGCHVRYSCENFHQQCGNCPLLRFSGKNDLSHLNWTKKQKAYSKLNFHVVAPSKWMAASVKQSSLLGIRNISVIPNTIETDIFKPYVKTEAKKILKITADKFVIMSGFMPSKNDKHKGTQYLIEALNELSSRSEIDRHKIELVIFGNKDSENMPIFPFKTTYLGTIHKDDHLAKCYSAADAFILPSLEDNLPNTVMESLACATPVIAFKTGGIPDMVKHLENGYLADYQSASDLADGIEWLYLHEDRESLQKEARRTILMNFSPSVIADKHLALYKTLINAQPK